MDQYFLTDGPQMTYEGVMDIPLSDSEYISRSFDYSYETAIGPVTAGYLFADNGIKIPRQEALDRIKSYKLDIQLGDDEEIDEGRLSYMIARKQRLTELDTQLSRGASSTLGAIGGFGAMLAGGVADPTTLATGLVPVVGPARYAQVLGRFNTVGGRAMARAGLGFAEGAASTALFEPAYAYMANDIGDDYGLYDSVMNIAFGGALGAVGGAAGGLIADRFAKTGLGGVASHIGFQDMADSLQIATKQFELDGRIDIENVVRNSVKKTLKYDLANVINDINLKTLYDNGDVVGLAQKNLDEYLSTNYSRQVDVLQQPVQNIYEKAMTILEDINNRSARTFDAESKQQELGKFYKRFGDDIETKSQDYFDYAAKRERIEAGQYEKSSLKTLEKDLETLDKKYNGEFRRVYDDTKANRPDVSTTDILDANRQIKEASQSYMEDLKNKLDADTTKAKEVAVNNIRSAERQRVIDEANKVAQDSKAVNDDVGATIDDEIAFLDGEYKAFEERTGLKVELEESEVDQKTVYDAVASLMKCMVG